MNEAAAKCSVSAVARDFFANFVAVCCSVLQCVAVSIFATVRAYQGSHESSRTLARPAVARDT